MNAIPPAAPRAPRLRAPELVGRRWLNTGGRDITLADLRGRVVVLDFWTFCCVNCLHVLDELRPLEERFGDQLVIVGVHSPKFRYEAEPAAVEAAVERYAVHHPVLDDPDLVTWRAYTARAWPTLVVLDPEGYIVASLSGEGHGPGLATLVEDLLTEHAGKGTLAKGPGPYVPSERADTPLRFPGKAVELSDGTWLVTDTTRHTVVRVAPDLETVLGHYGGPGTMTEPQGLALLPPEVADRVGYDVVVADSVGHRVLGLRLGDGALVTLAGTGEQLRLRTGGGAAVDQPLSTPWDVAWWQDRVVIAMAGTHQLWSLQLGSSPEENTLAVLAGTSSEGLKDGPAAEAWLAQTSGLVPSADPARLWVVDSETSSLRSLDTTDGGFLLQTHVGRGLFDFGHVDGAAGEALLQHPLGAAELPDGSVVVADTYNGALRRYDVATGVVSTLATGLAEPSDVVVPRDWQGGVVVVESGAHRLVMVPLGSGVHASGEAHRTQRPPSELPPGRVQLEVAFAPPAGQHLDDRWGDPTRLVVSASPPELLRHGAGDEAGLRRELELSGIPGVLHVSVQAAACDGDPETGEVAEHAACHLYQQDWGIPVVVNPGAEPLLRLDLRGVHSGSSGAT